VDFAIKVGIPEKQRGACVVVGVFEARKLTGPAKTLDKATEGYISSILKNGDLDGKANTTLLLHNVPNALCKRVLLVGLGKEKEYGDQAYLGALRATFSALNKTGAADATLFLTEIPLKGRDEHWKISRAVMVGQESIYCFDTLKSKKDEDKPKLGKVTLSATDNKQLENGKEAIEQGLAIANGMNLAKDLGNLAPNYCTPTYLADRAKEIAKAHKLKITVLEEKDMEKLGMGSLLSVSQGSRQPAKLIAVEYKGLKKMENPVVLVGKGVTFDTGGVSLKPSPDMDEMKYDMSGAASVLGTLVAVAEMNLPINLVCIVPATENMPDGQATKPGDVVTSMSGQTIEVLNTDAEGRLILCDALTYAARYKPDVVIDIATLTGACVIALGHVATGLISNDDKLAAEILRASEQSTDRAWQLPLWDDYQDLLKSNFADIANIGGRAGGTITAGCFLSRFTEDYRWAHLDIAGTAWKSGKEKGSTGRPVPLLTQFLITRAKQ